MRLEIKNDMAEGSLAHTVKRADDLIGMIDEAVTAGVDPLLAKHGFSADSTPEQIEAFMSTAEPEEAIKMAYSYIGQCAVSEASRVKRALSEDTDAYVDGFVKSCMAVGITDTQMTKLAQGAPNRYGSAVPYAAGRVAAPGAARWGR